MSKTETSTQLQHVASDRAEAIKIVTQNPEEPEIITNQGKVDPVVNLNGQTLPLPTC